MECAPATWDYAAAMGKAVVGRAREVPRAIAATLLAIAMLAGCGGSAGTSSTGGASGSAGAASGGRGGASGNTGASGSTGGMGGSSGGGAAGSSGGTAGGASGSGGAAGMAGTTGSGGGAGTGGAAGGTIGTGGAGGGGGRGGSGGAGIGGSSAGGAAGTAGRGGAAGAGTAGRGGSAAGTGGGGAAAAGTGGSNPDGGASDGPADAPICVPNCTGKSCGGDGCGGICATCASGQHCTASFTCAMNVANGCDPGSGLDPAAPWPTLGRCYARRAAASVQSVQKPVVAWSYATSMHSPAVVGRDGTIYFSKNAPTGNSSLLQAVRRDGTPAWSLAGGPTMSPTIGADGAIYFTTNTADTGQVVAVEPSGTVRWKANIGHTITPVLVGADGTVYATDDSGTLTALNGADGSVRFTRTNVSNGDWTTPAMASDGTMYMAYGNVTAMSATGNLLWQVPLQGSISGVALGPDGTLYVPFFGDATAGTTGGVRALDPATGATRWKVNFADDGEWLPAVAGDGTIYQPGVFALYAIDKNGKLLWVFPVGDYIGGVSLGGDGTIYVSGRDENLYALNPDGSVAWTLQVGMAARPPAIGADGTLYVEGTTGLMAIGCAGGTCAACVPNCAGRRCGPDGCGSSCGACGAGERCELTTRSCQPIAPPGGAGACGDNRGLQAGAPRPALGVCPTRSGRTDQLGPRTTPSIRWSFASGTSTPSTPSIAADGTLYFAASDRKLYAVRPDGSLRWTFAPRTGISVPPTIGADGTIYANDGSTQASGGYIYAIRPDGSKRWSLRFPFGTPSSPMVGGDGTVYAETYAYVAASRAVAIDPLTGTMRWATYAGAYLQAGPALGFDGSVYVHGSHLYGLTSSGGVLWHQETTFLGLPTAVPVTDANGNVYAAQDNTLIAFAPDGTTRWTYTLTPAGTTFGTVGGAPAIGADGSVLLPISDDSALAIVALDPATGAMRWQGYDGGNCSMSPAVDGGGWIYYVVTEFFSNKGILYALDSAGKLQWQLPLPTIVTKSLAIGANSILYVSGADGKLYALGP